MPTVTFFKINKSITVEQGVSLLDAASSAGVMINAPCGGEGACGDCRVLLHCGEVDKISRGCLSPEDTHAGWILACSSRIIEDIVVEVPEREEQSGGVVTESFSLPSGITSDQRVTPPVRKVFCIVEPPSLDNSFGDYERLLRSLDMTDKVSISLSSLQQLADALRIDSHGITITINDPSPGLTSEIIRVESGDTRSTLYGLAVDIGTTTCAAHLVDLNHGRILGTATGYNSQITRGSDIISRINYASQPDHLQELRSLVLDNLNGLIKSLCAQNGISISSVDCSVIVGNTTMIHLFLGLKPEYIRLEPYTPTINHIPPFKAKDVGLQIHPDSLIHIAPGVGSYVGCDITSGLLLTEFAVSESQDVYLYLDIGTNGEIVAGNSEWLMACAASAGPAFEGSGVSCGMRAMKGAIERIRIDPTTGRSKWSVIGNVKPQGICGSGMIDLLSELRTAGIIDPSGKILPNAANGYVKPCSDSSRYHQYTVATADEAGNDRDIYIDDRDILNLLRTKAAVYSACSLMLKSVGLEFDSVSRVYVAGGFGRYLDLEKSIEIGLLPDLPLDRYTYLGNAALAGAKSILTNQDARCHVVEVANRITYLELNADPAYMDEYLAALFLPHTDHTRFPSVFQNYDLKTRR